MTSYKPEELDTALQLFYVEVRKKDGTDYEPECLRVMRAGLKRYLKEKKSYLKSIIRDEIFAERNRILEGKAREMRDNGKGHRPNRARAPTEAEERILLDCGQFGGKTPQALLNTLWYFVTQHFGMRGRQEHHTIKIDDFEINIDDTGVEYFTFAEKRTKTRNTGPKPSVRQSIPKMFATGGEKCIVQIFKTYVSRRPEALRDSGPFYLQPLSNPRGITWFKRVPLGENTIGNMNKMKQNSLLSELCPSKKLTNHSARKTVVKKLQCNGVQKSEIRTITGHASTRGLDSYDEGDEHQQRALSNIIDGEESRLEARPKPVLSNTGRTVNFSRIAARVNPYQRTRALQPLHINTNPNCQQVPSQNRGLQHGSALTEVNNQPPRPIQQIFNTSNCRVSIFPSAPDPKPQSVFMRAINEEPYCDEADFQLFDGLTTLD